MRMRFQLFLALSLSCVCAAAAAAEEKVQLPAPSSSAQRLYSHAKADIVQLRSLLRNGRTQSSVGSGFLIGTGNLAVTNYHVMSQIALDPDTYVGEYVDTNGKRGEVKLLAVDVLHDLAVVSIDRKGGGFFNVPDQLPQLVQGQYLYSLGNPLDLGFAISEGAYNGIVNRSFYDQLMFTGPINSGMSGGPSVTVDGRVAGVNVSKRLDGELVSFLVPVRFVRDLLKKVAGQKQVPEDFKLVVGQQLLEHQKTMMERLEGTPLTFKELKPYKMPVWESDQVRCWGRSNSSQSKPYSIDQVNCAMESALFVSDRIQTGHISIQHKLLQSSELGVLRFSSLASNSFKNQGGGGHKDTRYTAPKCVEQFVTNEKLPMRAALCVRAYRKFPGLYDFTLHTASTDSGEMSLQSRIETSGVSYQSGLRIARIFLENAGRESKQ
ncbi:MAG: trypsin-like peptidase domain-containing protein [Nitrosomonadales bacterium]|nr:trypsin-like peptidase domain-containing protein [Nitrosomonadales bacterium]